MDFLEAWSRIQVEGIIGLKLQALTNDPRRVQDWVDIRNLIEKHRANLNLTQLYDYFLLFPESVPHFIPRTV